MVEGPIRVGKHGTGYLGSSPGYGVRVALCASVSTSSFHSSSRGSRCAGTVVWAIVGWVTKNPNWTMYAVMSGAIGLVFGSVVVAYIAGAFVFGF